MSPGWQTGTSDLHSCSRASVVHTAMSNSQPNWCSSHEEPQAGFSRFGPPYGGYYFEEYHPMAPAMRHVNPGARSRHLQWDFSLNRPLPPYEPATQEQAPHSAAHSSVSECATTDETRSGTSSRWTEQKSSVLISLWKEHLAHVESARNAEAWHKILAAQSEKGIH